MYSAWFIESKSVCWETTKVSKVVFSSLFFFHRITVKPSPRQLDQGALLANGAFANTSSCAYKSKRAGWQGFWREHFCRTWREDLCHFSVFTHQFVSCFFLFRAMENPPTSAAELDSNPDSPHLDQFSLLWWSAAVSTGPVSLTAQPSAPSWRSTTWKKREACRCRLALGFSPVLQSKATASCRRLSSGGFPGVADFVHGKMDGMHVWSTTASSSTFEAFPRTRAFVFTMPWQFCILASQVFNFFSSDRHFSSDKFSFGSSWPFFFFIFVFSLFLFCLPRNVFTFVLYYLAILAKHINISPSANDGMRVLSLCLQSSWHVRTCHAAGLDHFESSGRISACIVKEHWEARWKFSACHPVRDAMRDKT